MCKSLDDLGALVLLAMGVARAENPSPESLEAARSLVATLKLTDQYRALLPGILFSLRPTLTQDRPEIERDFDAMVPAVLETYEKYYNTMSTAPPRSTRRTSRSTSFARSRRSTAAQPDRNTGKIRRACRASPADRR